MLRGIASSDWHLMGMTKVLGANASQLQLKEIEKIYNYAETNGINHVFVPGDITDNPNMDDNTLIQLLKFLFYWDSKGINTYYSVGNHDWEHRDKSSLDVLKALADNKMFNHFHIFYTPRLMRIDGINCAFLPFPHVEVPKSKKNDKGRLIFAHIEVQGAIGDNGRPLKNGILDKINYNEKDYIISGHIHQHQIIKGKRFAYIGNPYQKNFGEKLPKGFIEFKAKNTLKGLRVELEFVDNHPSFILRNVEIKDQDDWAKLERNPQIKYKIHIDRNANVIVPKNVMTEFPNIAYMSGFDSTKVKNADTIMTVDVPKINLKTGLVKFLKTEGIDKSNFKKAKTLVNEAILQLRVS